jgi:hypothetical protein
MILQLLKFLHLIALVIAIGITLSNTIAHIEFWKLYDADKEKGLAAFQATKKFRVFGIFGLMLLIISGVLMLWLYQWTFIQLVWFQIKLFLVILLFVNGFTLGRTTSEKLDVIIKTEAKTNRATEIKKLKKRMQLFQFCQLIVYLLIIAVVVLRF